MGKTGTIPIKNWNHDPSNVAVKKLVIVYNNRVHVKIGIVCCTHVTKNVTNFIVPPESIVAIAAFKINNSNLYKSLMLD